MSSTIERTRNDRCLTQIWTLCRRVHLTLFSSEPPLIATTKLQLCESPVLLHYVAIDQKKWGFKVFL